MENFQNYEEGTSFKKLEVSQFCLGVNRRDSCFLSSTGEVVCVSNILNTPNGQVILRGRTFEVNEGFYVRPMPSSMLDIFKVSGLRGRETTWPLSAVKKKCMLFPTEGNGNFLSIPLVHCSNL